MIKSRRQRACKAAVWILAAIGTLVLGAFLFAWSGAYNIAASRGHWPVVEWFLEFGMSHSVKRRAWRITPPPLDNPDLIVLGAGHFHRACAHCHGAPGIKADLTAQQALPLPPELTGSSRQWKDNELFWIVKHGIKYTGMPAWVALERGDEIWSVVAFLKQLPVLGSEDYRRLALGFANAPLQSGRSVATLGELANVVGVCAHCHGAEKRLPGSGLVPVLHGQSRDFLRMALHAYASGRRRSGIMQPVAIELSSETIDKVTDYYAALASPTELRSPDAPAFSKLATEGDAATKIPACVGCHDQSALPVYPRLSGQNSAYMANRLRLWRDGLPSMTDAEAVMVPIARLLTDAQILEVSEYFARRRP